MNVFPTCNQIRANTDFLPHPFKSKSMGDVGHLCSCLYHVLVPFLDLALLCVITIITLLHWYCWDCGDLPAHLGPPLFTSSSSPPWPPFHPSPPATNDNQNQSFNYDALHWCTIYLGIANSTIDHKSTWPPPKGRPPSDHSWQATWPALWPEPATFQFMSRDLVDVY